MKVFISILIGVIVILVCAVIVYSGNGDLIVEGNL
jgi:hypothetical protein